VRWHRGGCSENTSDFLNKSSLAGKPSLCLFEKITMPDPAAAASPRSVTLPVAVAIVVANMIGTGVFGSLGFQVADLPSGFPVILLWIIGGLISFCGAVCYAELAAMMPRSGGSIICCGRRGTRRWGFSPAGSRRRWDSPRRSR
jgi:hypothetical protein